MGGGNRIDRHTGRYDRRGIGRKRLHAGEAIGIGQRMAESPRHPLVVEVAIGVGDAGERLRVDEAAESLGVTRIHRGHVLRDEDPMAGLDGDLAALGPGGGCGQKRQTGHDEPPERTHRFTIDRPVPAAKQLSRPALTLAARPPTIRP